MEAPKPAPQHELLQRLIGDWTFTATANMGPDKPPAAFSGKETVRGLGEVWILCEAQHDSSEGVPAKTLMTLGFDPQKGKFVGTFIASMMTYLWPYEGALDNSGKVITLESSGPSFADPNALSPYRDTITILSDNERTLTSQMPGPDGQWVEFMKCQYRRVAK
jgi:hypothetical protein